MRTVTARAPGRVNLIGEHTDYNAGYALPMALPFATTMRLTARPDRTVELDSVGYASTTFSLDDEPDAVDSWARYIAGMAALMAADGVPVSGFEAEIETTIPVGASLSSSAALEVATGFGLCGLAGVSPDAHRIAALGQRVENEIIGIQSGIMDQLASATSVEGTATLMDFQTLDTSPVAIPGRARVVIMDTMTRRELVDSEYDLRRQACERAAAALGVSSLREASLDDVASLPEGIDRTRAHHVVTENARVLRTVDALTADDLETVGGLMNESHESLSRDYEVSSTALDAMAALAREHQGCFGARMTGGGFAGSAVSLIEAEATDDFVRHLKDRWKNEHGVAPDIWPVDPSAGASVSANS